MSPVPSKIILPCSSCLGPLLLVPNSPLGEQLVGNLGPDHLGRRTLGGELSSGKVSFGDGAGDGGLETEPAVAVLGEGAVGLWSSRTGAEGQIRERKGSVMWKWDLRCRGSLRRYLPRRKRPARSWQEERPRRCTYRHPKRSACRPRIIEGGNRPRKYQLTRTRGTRCWGRGRIRWSLRACCQ